jgi:RNAse (barnase) inhibitor barstar
MQTSTYVIDGHDFDDLDGFYEQVGEVLLHEKHWRGNLDAFNDILYWPFDGTPYILVWKNSQASRERLGYQAMIRWLERRSQEHPPVNASPFTGQLERARNMEGPTIFDWLVEIIEANKEYVQLRLE